MPVSEEMLSLADLERHDPQAPPARGPERRFLCPFPSCSDKQNPHRHRSLAINIDTGAYYCHRCRQRGGLRDPRPGPTRSLRQDYGPSRLRRAFSLEKRPKASTTAPLERAEEIGVPIAQAPAGTDYLSRRGIPELLATAAAVRFSPAWGAVAGLPSEEGSGWPAIVFPMRDEHGAFIAAHGRAIRGTGKLTRGPTSWTLFATEGALQTDTVAITEGPIDALSLALGALPAVALIGTNAPHWLRKHAFSRRVLIATDADDAGDAAAAAITRQLGSYGATVERLRPAGGCKDWNDVLRLFGSEVLPTVVGAAMRADIAHRVPDPREDLSEDSSLWVALLTHAHELEGPATGELFGALHGARCMGIRLKPAPHGLTLIPGEMDIEAYTALRERYLLPHSGLLRYLLLTRTTG